MTAATNGAVAVAKLFDVARFPSDSYGDLALRVRLNPSGVVWEDFRRGGFHADDREQALLESLQSIIASPATSDDDRTGYQKRHDDLLAEIAARTERMSAALVALFGETEPFEVETEYGPVMIDFSTPAAAMATAEDDRLPDELTYWLVQLPNAVIERRREFIRSSLGKSFGKAN